MKITRLVSTLLLIALPMAALAQPMDFSELFELHVRKIRGFENPDDIPRAQTVRALPHTVGYLEVGDDDANILRQWATGARELISEQTRIAQANYRDRCARITAGHITAREFFEEAVELEERNNTELVASFDKAYQSLSERGQRALDAFVETSVLPGITFTTMDHEAMVAIANNTVTAQVAMTCEINLGLTERGRQIWQRIEARRRSDSEENQLRAAEAQQASEVSGQVEVAP